MRSVAFCVVLALPLVAHAQDTDLAAKARQVLETNCYSCHGKDGSNRGRFGYVLDVKRMATEKKLTVKNPAKSRIFARLTDADDPMPPEGQKPRPSKADIAIVRKWIEAGAPDFLEPSDLPEEKRAPITLADTYKAMEKHLLEADQTRSAHLQRFFTLTHLHNNPKVTDAQMRLYRAGLAKLLNSLSWRKAIVYPRPIDPAGTILALDLRDLDWDLNDNWAKVIGFDPRPAPKNPLLLPPHQGYPYALKHHFYPEDPKFNTLAKRVYELGVATSRRCEKSE